MNWTPFQKFMFYAQGPLIFLVMMLGLYLVHLLVPSVPAIWEVHNDEDFQRLLPAMLLVALSTCGALWALQWRRP